MRKLTYRERAERLAKTIDIADKIVRESQTIPDNSKHHFLNWGREIKDKALNPEPQFKKVASIQFLENDFLIYWNEAKGPDIDKFWTEIHKSGIDFERKDTIQTVLKRNKIKDIHEYDDVIDNIVVAEQTGRIGQEQVKELNRLIGEFEQRQNEKKK
jgi:hypothetical protein